MKRLVIEHEYIAADIFLRSLFLEHHFIGDTGAPDDNFYDMPLPNCTVTLPPTRTKSIVLYPLSRIADTQSSIQHAS